MKKFKKALRLIAFILLIVLASLGVGLSGGVPIPTMKKRNQKAEEHAELVESKNEEPTWNMNEQKV